MRRYPITLLILRILLAPILLAPMAQARAETVRDWGNSIYYPARVITVRWENGRLDARTSIRFGAWTLRFGPSVHFAHIFGGNVITIAGDNPNAKGPTGNNVFRCRNAAVGERLCSLSFWLNFPNLGRRGFVSIWMTTLVRDQVFIDIPCPIALDLAH